MEPNHIVGVPIADIKGDGVEPTSMEHLAVALAQKLRLQLAAQFAVVKTECARLEREYRHSCIEEDCIKKRLKTLEEWLESMQESVADLQRHHDEMAEMPL